MLFMILIVLEAARVRGSAGAGAASGGFGWEFMVCALAGAARRPISV
jgi:hypothetical protein